MIWGMPKEDVPRERELAKSPVAENERNELEANVYPTTVKNLLALGALLGFSLLTANDRPSVSNDQLTGLALHDGLTFQQEVDSPICGKKAQINIYNAPPAGTLAEYLAWYKDHLENFHYVHKIWNKRAQDMFYSPDGLTGTSITGSAVGPGVFSVSYLKMSVRLTAHDMDVFSPTNPSCK
jgi:hypothetical protein